MTALDVKLDTDGTEENIIDMDTGMVLSAKAPPSSSSSTSSAASPPPPPPLTDKDEIKQFLYDIDEVFLDELPEEENESSNVDIDLDARTEEIATLLQTDSSLEAAFSRLTDQIDYKQFWKRYFYRFAEERLQETYHHYYYVYCAKIAEQEQEEEETRVSGLGLGAFKGVTSFLGGAVKRMIEEGQDDEQEDGEDEEGEPGNFFNTAQQTGVNAMSFFKGGAHRPPFVLNTAVSENEDDEEEEEEEELGWDDDDDDEEEEDDEKDDEEDDRVGQIEFKDAEKEQMQEQLEQAMTERDMLHKTVELQTEEIRKLKEGVASVDENKQVEALKMQLFEKDSELAALRARLEDDRDRDTDADADGADNNAPPASNVELEALRAELAQRDSQIIQLQQDLQVVTQKLESKHDSIAAENSEAQELLGNAMAEVESQKFALLEANNENGDLQAQLQAMKDIIERLELENDTLRKNSQNPNSDSEAELESTRQDLSQVRLQVTALSSQNIALEEQLEAEKLKLSTLDTILATTQATLDAKDQELGEKTSLLQIVQNELEFAKAELAKKTVPLQPAHPSSPGSTSTGVKVPSPSPAVEETEPAHPIVAKVQAERHGGGGGEDDDSDWGDW